MGSRGWGGGVCSSLRGVGMRAGSDPLRQDKHLTSWHGAVAGCDETCQEGRREHEGAAPAARLLFGRLDGGSPLEAGGAHILLPQHGGLLGAVSGMVTSRSVVVTTAYSSPRTTIGVGSLGCLPWPVFASTKHILLDS